MAGSVRARLIALLLLLFPALITPLRAQLVLGQYEDEAPLGTWNIFGAASAPALGRGAWGFAQTGDVGAALVNPALIASLPKYSLTVTGSYSWASLFRYSLVNTGVIASRGNLSVGAFGADEGAVTIRLGRFALAASAGLAEDYGRPAVFVSSDGSSNGLRVTQDGLLRDFGLTAGAKLGTGDREDPPRVRRTRVGQHLEQPGRGVERTRARSCGPGRVQRNRDRLADAHQGQPGHGAEGLHPAVHRNGQARERVDVECPRRVRHHAERRRRGVGGKQPEHDPVQVACRHGRSSTNPHRPPGPFFAGPCGGMLNCRGSTTSWACRRL